MNRFWNFFIDHFRFTYVVLTMVVLLGLVSILTMPKESAPEVIIPIGVVSTPYPGASALDVEELVTNEIEDEIEDLDDLDSFTSTSSEGISSIVVEFDADADIDDRIRALKDAVDDALPDLPDEVDRSIVTQISLADEPVVIVSLSADMSDEALKLIAEDVQEDLERISGLTEAKLVGTRDREVQVTVDPLKLELYQLSLGEVVQAIQRHDAQLPVGSIEQAERTYTVRFEGGLKDPELINRIPIKTLEGSPVLIQDVATVTDGLEQRSTISRLSVDGKHPASAVTVEIFKQEGADILEMVGAVYERLDELEQTLLKDVEVFISFDLSEEIRDDLFGLLGNGMQTVIIVALILMVFLGRREALLTGFCIPLTFLMTFVGLSYFGFTINFLTLFSLILSLGILVDATIVIVEGMHMHINLGKPPAQAAKATIKEFQWPVMAGIFTTVSAFVPMLFASGITGQYIRTIPVTVSLVLMSSLIVAMAFMPVLGSRLLKQSHAVKEDDEVIAKVGWIRNLAVWYKGKLEWVLSSRKVQRRILGILTLLFFAAVSLPFLGILEATLFPESDENRFFIDVEAPVGTVIEKTDRIVREIEDILLQDENIVSFVSSVGSTGGQSVGGGSGSSSASSHVARFSINLTESDARDIESYLIVDQYRERLKHFSAAEITISQIGAGPPQGAPVEVTFSGPDLDELDRLARDAEKLLLDIEGPTSIERSLKDAPLEFAYEIDREKAAQVGLTPLDVATALRTAVFGVDAVTLKIAGDDVDVVVQLNLNATGDDPHQTQQTTLSRLNFVNIATPNGSVPLTALVREGIQSGTTSIAHDDGVRTSKVNAYLLSGFTVPGVLGQFEDRVEELQLPSEYQVSFGGEAQEVQESFTDLYNALIIGLLLILAILVLQFNSFRQPFLIMASLPFALIGVLPGLTITNQPLSFPAFIGIVALVGIVVNDAIILIDQINNNRRDGMERKEAVVQGTLSRLQPIMLTTITTVFGILPLTLSDPVWGPLGFSIIFGLIFATVLTLMVVPSLYYRFAEKEL